MKVLDFGVSKALDATLQTESGVIVGTPAYLAPEQADPDLGPIGPRTDQFALAGLAYEMLTGDPPFGAGTLPAVVYRIVHEPSPELAPGVPKSVRAAISRALEKRPEDRFEHIGDFAAALVRNDETAPSRATRKWTILAGAVALSVAAVGVVALEEPTVPIRSPVVVSDPGLDPRVAAVETARPRATSARAPVPTAVVRPIEARAPAASGRLVRRDPATAPRPGGKRRAARSAEVEQFLSDANAALKRRDWSAAIHLGGRLARAGARGEGAAVVARAHCGRKHLGRSRAAFELVPKRLAGAVLRHCRRFGVDLR